MIKTTGAEFMEFYTDSTIWVEGLYHDGEEVYIDGSDDPFDGDYTEIEPNAVIRFKDGYVMNDNNDSPDFLNSAVSFEDFFKRWRKDRKFTYLVVRVPNESVVELNSFLKTIKGSVKK